MTMAFPAYFNDPRRKADLIARLTAADWSRLDDLEHGWRTPDEPSAGWAAPLHQASGFPASILYLAAALFRSLAPDRRGRFLVLLFDAAEVGADLSEVADTFLAALTGQTLAECSLPVTEYPQVLERALQQEPSLDPESCAELLIATLAAA